MRNFRFFKKNDGTESFPNNICDEYHQIITELEERNTLLHNRLSELNRQLDQHQGRISYGDFQNIRDEQRIDRTVAINFTNRDDFFMHLRRQQATRIVERLLENNLIDHTFRPDEPNGDYFSRMDLKVVINNSQ